jgi:hypothetical protein
MTAVHRISKMRMPWLALLLAFVPGFGFASDTTALARPIVLELYTSEGCSSCPPAEALAVQLAPRKDLLVLAFHVDYWDELGWRDRFSLPAATERQRRWARGNDTWEVYTPQLIVDGRQSMVGSDASAVAAAIQAAHVRNARGPARSFTATIAAGQVLVDAAAAPNTSALELYVIAYQPQATTAVPRGENAGRTLFEANAVRSIARLGSVANGAIHLTIATRSFPADASRIAVLLQDARTGAIEDAQALALR